MTCTCEACHYYKTELATLRAQVDAAYAEGYAGGKAEMADLVERMRAELAASQAIRAELENRIPSEREDHLRARLVQAEARAAKMEAGWEVEGFIDRLTRRDATNSERLVLEAISHLRTFSRDRDALRAAISTALVEAAAMREVVNSLWWLRHPK